MPDKEVYQQKMEAELNEWSAKLDALKAKAQTAGVDAKIKYQQEIESLQGKKEAAHKKLAELKGASEGAWEDIKGGFEKAWADIKNSLDDARSKFK